MREFRLPRAFAGDISAPVLLVCGTRIEALRLLPLLRALRAPGRGAGALLLDTGESGAVVRETLREHGLAADLRLPPARGTAGMAFALARLCMRLRPSLVLAGGASGSGLAAALAARFGGCGSALLVSNIESVPRWRWRLLARLHTWFYLGREQPRVQWPRGRAQEVGDPLFDLCREQAQASNSAGEGQGVRALLAWRQAPENCEHLVAGWIDGQPDLRLDWIAAPMSNTDSQAGLRRLGELPHWRALALARRAAVLLTDDPLLAVEARWLSRPVLWLGPGAAPFGSIATGPAAIAQSLRLAVNGSLVASPLDEDGRAAPRLAAHLLNRIEQRAFAGILTRAR